MIKNSSDQQFHNLFPNRIRSASEAKKSLPCHFHTFDEGKARANFYLNSSPGRSSRVVYFHIPFCSQTCSFCFYNRCLVPDFSHVESFFRTIEGQIGQIGQYPWISASPFSAVYFGGGSPLSVSPDYIVCLLNCLRNHFPLTPNCEVTVETTVKACTNDSLGKLVAAGVNRISLGVQSFDTAIRQMLGRSSNIENILETIDRIQKAGISNICADLIYNLPGQTLSAWENDLEHLDKSGLTGCSIYPLIIAPGSAIFQQKSYILPEIETEYRYFQMAFEFVGTKTDWAVFSPVQYGHHKFGRAEYVTAHAGNSDILSFGPSAMSRINNLLLLNPPAVEEYYSEGQDYFSNHGRFLEVDTDFSRLRNIFRLSDLGLLNDYEMDDLYPVFGDKIEDFISLGLIEHRDKAFRLTCGGFFWAGNISSAFAETAKEHLAGIKK